MCMAGGAPLRPDSGLQHPGLACVRGRQFAAHKTAFTPMGGGMRMLSDVSAALPLGVPSWRPSTSPQPSSPSTAGTNRAPRRPRSAPGANSFLVDPTGRQDRWMQGRGRGQEPSRGESLRQRAGRRAGASALHGPHPLRPRRDDRALVASASARSPRWAHAAATVKIASARLPGTAYLTFRDVRETFTRQGAGRGILPRPA